MEVGAALGIHDDDLEGIFEKHSRDHTYAALDMLFQWRDKSKATTDSRTVLTRTLHKLNRRHESTNQGVLSAHGKLMSFFLF